MLMLNNTGEISAEALDQIKEDKVIQMDDKVF